MIINEQQLNNLCNRYNIKYQYFDTTNTLLLSTPLDEWQIKYVGNRDRPYCLLHKNKIKQTKKFHVQRWVSNLIFAIHTIIEHKKVLVNLYGSPRIHKQNNKITRKKGVKTNYK